MKQISPEEIEATKQIKMEEITKKIEKRIKEDGYILRGELVDILVKNWVTYSEARKIIKKLNDKFNLCDEKTTNEIIQEMRKRYVSKLNQRSANNQQSKNHEIRRLVSNRK